MNDEIELILPNYIETKKEKMLKILMHVTFMIGITMFFNILYEIKYGFYFIRSDIPLFAFLSMSLIVLIFFHFVQKTGAYPGYIKQNLDDQGFCPENAKEFGIELYRPSVEMVVSNKKTNELYKALIDVRSNTIALKPLKLIKQK